MQRSIVLLLLTALSLTSAPGCSDDAAEPSGDGALLTIEEYCRSSAEQICGVLAPCCSAALEVCVERYRMSCSESAANASQKGQRFDADAARQCIDSIPGAYEGCSPRPPEHPQVVLALGSCSATFRATLEPGQRAASTVRVWAAASKLASVLMTASARERRFSRWGRRVATARVASAGQMLIVTEPARSCLLRVKAAARRSSVLPVGVRVSDVFSPPWRRSVLDWFNSPECPGNRPQ